MSTLRKLPRRSLKRYQYLSIYIYLNILMDIHTQIYIIIFNYSALNIFVFIFFLRLKCLTEVNVFEKYNHIYI